MLPCVLLLALHGFVSASTTQSIMVVDLRDTSIATPATTIAVQSCAGLFNRKQAVAGPAYVLMNSRDLTWLETVEAIKNPVLTPALTFVKKCLQSRVAQGFIRYNVTLQHLLLPNIITLAGVLDAVPLADGEFHVDGSTLVFDALATFADFSAHDATSYMYQNFVNRTTSMSKMNPGLDTHGHPLNPPLTRWPDFALADYIVKERLFNFFLNDGCIPGTKDHALMEQMVKDNPWPKPIPVYGYDDTFGVAGDLFEAETTCVKERNMGQIASSGVSNLAFFSRKPPINTPIIQNPEKAQQHFNKSKTYITLIVGDGDNVAFVRGSRRDWVEQRVRQCQADPSSRGCFPLVWTLSPHVLHLAPDWARWYFEQSHATQHDYFVLPPSGDLYSYPSLMHGEDQDAFIRNTEKDCTLLNTSGIVAWEWFGSWAHAIERYFPKYSEHGIVNAAFAVDVPFDLPVPSFWKPWKQDRYKVLNDRVVLFRPREWRGTSGSSSIPFSKDTMLSAKDMAAELNAYPKGTVSHIYLTSDGGAKLDDLYDLVKGLQEHVSIVSHGVAARMALQASAARYSERQAPGAAVFV